MKTASYQSDKSSAIWFMLVFTLLLLASTAFISFYNATQYAESSAKTDLSLKILVQLEKLMSDLKDAETGQRGYLLTGKPSYLKPYDEAQESIIKDLRELSGLAGNDVEMRSQIQALGSLVYSKLDELRQTTELQTHGDSATARKIVNTDSGKKLMDDIRVNLNVMTTHMNAVLNEQNTTVTKTSSQTAFSTAALAVSIAASVVVMMYLLMHQSAQRKAAEEAIRSSEEKFRTLISSVLDYAIIMLDTKGNVVTWNDGAERLQGYTQEEIIGKHFSCFYQPADIDRKLPSKLLKEAIEQGSCETFGWRVRKDGSQFYANVVIRPTKDSAGKLKGFSKVTRDITERHVVEERLLQSKQELEVLNKELSLARDQAQAASKFKSEFVANMSHEIRTPMNGIVGMCNVLLRTKLDESQNQYARAIQSAADALLTVINDILDFSKIEAGRIELEMHEFDIASMVEGVCEILAVQARTKRLSLLSYVDVAIPRLLRGDAERLRQVLLNLASNAIKFTESGEVVVKAEIDSMQENMMNIVFSVTDYGIGLTQDEQQKLFQPFVQADGSISRKFGGTGLGLSISKSLVELMGGAIGVRSKKGEGSTFWFKVPLEARGVKGWAGTHEALKNVRVLIIDDEPNAREILQKYVQSWGMQCGTAVSASDAVEQLHTASVDDTPYKVAIVDLVMPEKNGIEMAKEILNDQILSRTDLVLLTAFDTPGLGAQAIDMGFKAFITKPVRQSQLLDCLTDVVCKDTIFNKEINTSSFENQIEQQRSELILVVEDHPINQRVAQLYLEELGFTVDIASNGKEALNALSMRTYSLVFMDCQMPEMDGLLATKIIRKRELSTGAHVPIVAMTAHAMREDKDRCIAVGMDDYLSKPVDPKTLREMLDKWLPLPKSGQSKQTDFDISEVSLDLSKPVNIENINAKFGAGGKELIKMFVDDAPVQIVSFRKSLQDKNFQEIADTAHKVRGVCAVLGIAHMETTCHAIEDAARKNDEQALQKYLDDLENQFTVAKGFLNEYYTA
jgi:PAS domain S-box-containing protein